jgi:hypothetical protein
MQQCYKYYAMIVKENISQVPPHLLKYSHDSALRRNCQLNNVEMCESVIELKHSHATTLLQIVAWNVPCPPAINMPYLCCYCHS